MRANREWDIIMLRTATLLSLTQQNIDICFVGGREQSYFVHNRFWS